MVVPSHGTTATEWSLRRGWDAPGPVQSGPPGPPVSEKSKSTCDEGDAGRTACRGVMAGGHLPSSGAAGEAFPRRLSLVDVERPNSKTRDGDGSAEPASMRRGGTVRGPRCRGKGRSRGSPGARSFQPGCRPPFARATGIGPDRSSLGPLSNLHRCHVDSH